LKKALIVLYMLNVASEVHTSMSDYLAHYNIFLVLSHLSKFWHFNVAEFLATIDLSIL